MVSSRKESVTPCRTRGKVPFPIRLYSFTDGNGRTARLLMNVILMSFGYPPAIVKAEQGLRLKYYETLEEAGVQSVLNPFIESLKRYIAAVK
jgi:Fic family protein